LKTEHNCRQNAYNMYHHTHRPMMMVMIMMMMLIKTKQKINEKY